MATEGMQFALYQYMLTKMIRLTSTCFLVTILLSNLTHAGGMREKTKTELENLGFNRLRNQILGKKSNDYFDQIVQSESRAFNQRNFEMSLAKKSPAGERLKRWLERFKGRYIAHGVWSDNIKKVLSSGALKPAELVLRETGQVSQEFRLYNTRENISVRSPEIRSLFEKVGPIEPCQGIMWIKFLNDKESGKSRERLMYRREGSLQWQEKATPDFKSKDWDELTREEKAEEQGFDKLREFFTSSSGEFLDMELPIVECRGRLTSQDYNYLSGRFHFSFLVNKSEPNQRKQDQLIQFADSHFIPRDSFIKMHDEFYGRSVDLEIAKTFKSYQREFNKFRDRYERLADEQDQAKKLKTLSKFELTLPEVRFFYYGGSSPRSYISFSQNGLSRYGDTFILIGDHLSTDLGITYQVIPKIFNCLS